MKKNCVLLLMLLLIMSKSFAGKDKQFYFKINGTINVDTGTISLRFFPDYTQKNVQEIVASVKNNKFSFSGYITEPQGVYFFFEDRYMSSDFIIDKGIQAISINIDSMRKTPTVLNEIMINEYPHYISFFKQQSIKRSLHYHIQDSLLKTYNYQLPDSIKIQQKREEDKLYETGNNLLLQYCETNPNSKIAFWTLIRKMSWGYEQIFDSIFDSFSSEMKTGYAGRVLKNKLDNGKALSVGKIFPIIQSVNCNNEMFSIAIFAKNTLTLVDFWYTGCGPCRAQFTRLKDLYRQYRENGFEIVGISVDRDTDKKKWEDVIIKDKLIWQQFWDMNGKSSQSLSIYVLPTNFLIDSSGKIIAKNISLDELEVVLKKTHLEGANKPADVDLKSVPIQNRAKSL